MVFFLVCAGLSWHMGRAYALGYWRDILESQFDITIYFGAVGVSLIMTVVCLNFASPLDTLNYISRLERQVMGMRKALKIYRDNPDGAVERDLAGRILTRMGDGDNVVVRHIGRKQA